MTTHHYKDEDKVKVVEPQIDEAEQILQNYKGRCFFVSDETGGLCSEVPQNCHAISNSAVLDGMKDEKSGKVMELRWVFKDWKHLIFASNPSHPIHFLNSETYVPPQKGISYACTGRFACPRHDQEFAPHLDVTEIDLESPVSRFLLFYRTQLFTLFQVCQWTELLELYDKSIMRNGHQAIRPRWLTIRSQMKEIGQRLVATADRLGMIWYEHKKGVSIDSGLTYGQSRILRSPLKFAACGYANDAAALAYPIGEEWHRLDMVGWNEEPGQTQGAVDALSEKAEVANHGDRSCLEVMKELSTKWFGIAAVEPESYKALNEEWRNTVNDILVPTDNRKLLMKVIDTKRNPSRKRRY